MLDLDDVEVGVTTTTMMMKETGDVDDAEQQVVTAE